MGEVWENVGAGTVATLVLVVLHWRHARWLSAVHVAQ